MTKTPDEILSEKIMSALIEQKLIPEKIINKYKKTIFNGAMTQEDWLLMTEILETKPEAT